MIQKLTNKLTNRKKDNKGFTLVELIVVIVILAILAAILIPGVLKWIDKAKEEQYTLEARNVYLAVQAEVAEAYAADPNATDKPYATEAAPTVGKAVEKLSDVAVKKITATYNTTDADKEWELTGLTVKFNSNGKGITAVMTGNKSWDITVGTAHS